ncbi:MAG: hypothetical protein AAFO69_02330 [Bacteroidota bacterium]
MSMIKYITFMTFFIFQAICLEVSAQQKGTQEEDLKARLAAVEKELAENTDSKLKQKVKQLQTELKALNKKVKSLEKENSKLKIIKSDYDELKVKYDAAESERLGYAQLQQQNIDYLDSIVTLNNELNGLKTTYSATSSDLQTAKQQLKVSAESVDKLQSKNVQLTTGLGQARDQLAPFQQRNKDLANFIMADLQENALSIAGGIQFKRDMATVDELISKIQDIRSQNLLGKEEMGRLEGLDRKLKNYVTLGNAIRKSEQVLQAAFSMKSTNSALMQLGQVNEGILSGEQKAAHGRLTELLKGYCVKNSDARKVMDTVNKFAITFKTPSEAIKDLNTALNSGSYASYPYLKSQLQNKKKSGNISRNYNPFPAASCN